jgi:hypothetical protein
MSTTPPPSSSLPLPGTPFKHHSGTTDRFGPKYEARTTTVERLSYDMSFYFVGPVPPQFFLDSFLPLTSLPPPANVIFRPGMFAGLAASTKESQMYEKLVN